MKNGTKKQVLASILLGGAMIACTSEPDAAAPDVALDDVATRDQGSEYNGWSHQQALWTDICGGYTHMLDYFTKSYGSDTTRGGGVCLVYATGAGCSSDGDCQAAAVGTYGSSAYGYCYSGACYSRPGGQSSFCQMGANRSNSAAGTMQTNWDPSNTSVLGNNGYLVGCMTKTAGPNTACGGTNTSLYMRMLSARVWQDDCDYGGGDW